MRYWAKYRKDHISGVGRIHLLPCHLLDVAAVGYLMVTNNLFGAADTLKQVGLEGESGAQFFAWLLSSHDIGKFACSFQREVWVGGQEDCRELVCQNFRHDVLGYAFWREIFEEPEKLEKVLPKSELGTGRKAGILDIWISVTTGHHGVPPKLKENLNNFTSQNKKDAFQYLEEALKLFPLAEIPVCFKQKEVRHRTKYYSWVISGLVVLCDWIGSNEKFFQWVDEEFPLKVYWEKALSEAERALAILPPSPKVSEFQNIRSLFPYIHTPSPLQEVSTEIQLNKIGAQLFILEDLTGSGKTESALTLAKRLMSSGRANGIFYALPTMATANAMYSRLVDVLSKLYLPGSKPSLILAHSRSRLMEGFTSKIWDNLLKGSSEFNNETPVYAGCASWFAESSKKALLADVGVGTIDQALMGVLQFRHNNLRLLGLEKKVFIVDEVHAYDAYMGKELEQLISVLAYYGAPIILLSATMSQTQRTQYLSAFQSVLSVEPSKDSDVETLSYPLFTKADSNGIESIPVLSNRPRNIDVSWLSSEKQCIEYIIEKASSGKSVVWIRNTIDDALRAFRSLLSSKKIDPEKILLFHSRFAFSDRQRIEEQAVSELGKRSSSERAGKIVIATQVIEQSLDIDADELISDLAPIDLLVQRSGRLHRHNRDASGRVKDTGADERGTPVLHILAPRWAESPQQDWYSAMFHAGAYVYPNHARLWLTQKVLREQGTIQLPDNARLLIESVYGNGLDIPSGLQDSALEDRGKEYSARSMAKNNLIVFSAGYSSVSFQEDLSSADWNSGVSDDIDDSYFAGDVSTRLASESVNIWLAQNTNGKIIPYSGGDGPEAWESSRLSVRRGWWEKNKNACIGLSEDCLEDWCREHKKNKDYSLVLLVEENCDFYTDREGLVGNNKKQEE